MVIDERPVDVRLSRGQEKLLLGALRLAQGLVTKNATGAIPILLVDDFFAELDISNARLFLDLVSRFAGQSILTSAIAPITVIGDSVAGSMFHVEHGALIVHP